MKHLLIALIGSLLAGTAANAEPPLTFPNKAASLDNPPAAVGHGLAAVWMKEVAVSRHEADCPGERSANFKATRDYFVSRFSDDRPKGPSDPSNKQVEMLRGHLDWLITEMGREPYCRELTGLITELTNLDHE